MLKSIGYTHQNSIHYYEAEEGLDQGEMPERTSNVMQQSMAAWAQQRAKEDRLNKANKAY